MTCRCSPALVALRDQLDAAHPERSKASDGCCGDPAHQARVSDHNPVGGYAHAYDVTHDPANGVDCHILAPLLLGDSRVTYLIWDRKIATRGGGWRAYGGSNPHTKHCHVSISHDATHVTARWPLAAPTQEDDMPPAAIRRGTSGPEHAVLPNGTFQLDADEKTWLVRAGFLRAGAPEDLDPAKFDGWFGPAKP